MTASNTGFDAAVAALQHGEAVIFPTETVYGLGVAVNAVSSPETLYELKERDRGKPISWLIADKEDLVRYGADVPGLAVELAQAYWPGPLTLIVRAGDAVPGPFRAASGTIGLRMPDSHTALSLISACGAPVAATSANMSGQAATGRKEGIDPHLATRVKWILTDEDDDNKSGVPSTVIDCTGVEPVIVRQGAITAEDIQALR